ncbi:MAG: hypothetical protein DI569_05990 [Sphingopyxis macrogoltabida]|uniref:Uncharacterized protein n=1 Tax=Sphingopyxis macrogoltabida TaxID=33050 RepID=A0A2W5L6A7_SPHMC|nr:MAG: hypothetical protein DI569_05990 [Sphingopyxis macrogoltabida]
MYAFIDQPVEQLHNSGRFLLWAMRGWADAARRGICPPRALHRAFRGMNAHHVLPDFHVAMALVTGDALRPVALSHMGCRRIGEDEAILLGLWQGVGRGCFPDARATLALFVTAESIAPIANAMHAAAAGLAEAGFDLSHLSLPSMNHQESR